MVDNGKKIQTITFLDGREPLKIEAETIKEAVEKAVKNGVSLDGASLNGASLDGASLDGASLKWASLNGASLDEASLNGASLGNAIFSHHSISSAKRDGRIIRKVLTIGPLGSVGRMTNLLIYTDSSVEIVCGCFSGDLAAFRAKVRETHGESRFAAEYLALADFFEKMAKVYAEEKVEK